MSMAIIEVIDEGKRASSLHFLDNVLQPELM
jgi:hypothetical protein